jgi:hypothetical protein
MQRPSILHSRAVRRPRSICRSDACAILVTTRATVRERAGSGLRLACSRTRRHFRLKGEDSRSRTTRSPAGSAWMAASIRRHPPGFSPTRPIPPRHKAGLICTIRSPGWRLSRHRRMLKKEPGVLSVWQTCESYAFMSWGSLPGERSLAHNRRSRRPAKRSLSTCLLAREPCRGTARMPRRHTPRRGSPMP